MADENTGRRPGLSRSQIDRIGDRLRKRQLDPSTLTELDEYRRSFEPAYEEVVQSIQLKLGVTPTGRAGKSIPSIIEKLERESIRLSQMQDIAGCRIVCADIPEQDRVVAETESLFDDATIIDRRVRPSYGYRAVHVVVRISKFPVEIQVRTVIQHLWAEYSEIMSDVVDRSLKYGGGPENCRENLALVSRTVARLEAIPAGTGGIEREKIRLELIEMFRKFIPMWERLRE